MYYFFFLNMFRLNESKLKKLNYIDLKLYIMYCLNI